MMLDAAMARSEDGLGEDIMNDPSLESMSTDQLWLLYELVVAELGCKIATERDVLVLRLRKLGVTDGELRREKRPYPKVFPKYRNPKNYSETWAGRGKQPRWLATQLRTGKKLTDFLIR
jgi:DNA-binding protein H-NS